MKVNREESGYIVPCDKIAWIFFLLFFLFFFFSSRYRRCATRYNPAQQKNEGAVAIFALAAEAYDVLSDPLRRAVYDQYGEEGLKNGVPGPEVFAQPYVYHGEPMRTFRWKGKLYSH